MQTHARIILVIAASALILPACARDRGGYGGGRTASAGYEQPPPQAYPQPQGERPPPPSAGTYDEPTRGAGHDAASRGEHTQQLAELEQRYAEACPMHVGGTQVTAQTVPNGAALVFTTPDDVDQLRAQVDRFADAHNELAEEMDQEGAARAPSVGASASAGGARAGMHADQHGSFVPSRAEVEAVEGGAEIILTPRDPSGLEALRQSVEAQARQMASGACPLIEHQPQGGAQRRLGG